MSFRYGLRFVLQAIDQASGNLMNIGRNVEALGSKLDGKVKICRL